MINKLHVVTIEWLKMCICKQTRVPEINFRAEADPSILTLSENKVGSSRMRNFKYTVKKNLF